MKFIDVHIGDKLVLKKGWKNISPKFVPAFASVIDGDVKTLIRLVEVAGDDIIFIVAMKHGSIFLSHENINFFYLPMEFFEKIDYLDVI